MIPFVIYQNKSRVAGEFGYWYARTVSTETIDLEALAKHMSQHHTPFSKGTIVGILADMVSCIKELLLEGKNIKIDNLAIFSTSLENRNGAPTAEDYTVQKNVKCIKMNALATGDLSKANLNLEASLQERSSYSSPKEGTGQSVNDGTGHSVTVNAGVGGKVTASPATAGVDQTVTLTIAPDSGYTLASITASDGDTSSIELTTVDATHRTFVMGSTNVIVTATFVAN